MEPTTVIALTTAAASLADTLVSTWSDVIGKCEMLVCIVNATEDVNLKLVYQSEPTNSGQHGKFVKEPAGEVILPRENQSISSAKRSWETYGNCNGVVYRAQVGKVAHYLTLCWENPYSGQPYYHIGWSNSWSRDEMDAKLLQGLAKRQVADPERHSIYGIQRVETSDKRLKASASFGIAPLKVVVHN
jgi:hypothetical protein